MDFIVLFEDENLLVVNKPQGVNVHSDNDELGLVARLNNLYQKKFFLVHRLDKMTSGILLLAKNSSYAATLAGYFAEKLTEKYYLAISTGRPNKKQGLIIGDMVSTRRGSWKLTRSRKNPAITQFFSQSIGNGLRGYLLKPITGKTHQLRVAMKSISAPILGDSRYGGEDADRGYLHSTILRIPDPSSNEQTWLTFSAPIKQYWPQAEWPEQWDKPWLLPWPLLKN